jgi:pimeloyl-ACP methyl ester carboxylesterase
MNHRILVGKLLLGSAIFTWLFGMAINAASAQRGPDRPYDRPPERPIERRGGARDLVIIVPGRPGEDADWARIEPGRASFASELERTAGERAEVVPFFWHGGEDHPGREAAAHELARLIDDRAPRAGQLTVLGYSFGGDIALRAAGLAREHIDLLITLSTPNVYVESRGGGEREPIYLPVFCDYHARENVGKIINIFPSREDLPSGWADTFFFEGLTRSDEVPMTDSWRDHMDYDRLHDPASAPHVITSGEVLIARRLNVADANLKVQSQVTPWEAQHAAAHSRRMGAILGDFIHDDASAKAQDYVEGFIEPADSDRGEAIPEDAQRQWNRDHEAEFDHFGWRLDEVSVDVTPADRRAASSIHDVSVRLEIGQATGAKKEEHVEAPGGSDRLSAAPDWLVRDRQSGDIAVFLGDRKIADAPIRADEPPPNSVQVDPLYAVDVKSDFKWIAVHH